MDRSLWVGSDSRLLQYQTIPGRLCRQGTLFVVLAQGLGEFPGAVLGMSRLAMSASGRRLLAGKLPPVLFEWMVDLLVYITYSVTRSGCFLLG